MVGKGVCGMGDLLLKPPVNPPVCGPIWPIENNLFQAIDIDSKSMSQTIVSVSEIGSYDRKLKKY